MGNFVVALNQTDVSVRIRVLDDTDGTPATGVLAATAGHEVWYQRGFLVAAVTDAAASADHTLITDAHDDWDFIHIREGWYRVDFPDAAFAEGVGTVICGMNATGFSGVSVQVDIEPLFKFQGKASSVTATTTTFPAGTDPYKGDLIYAVDGTGIKQTRLVASVSGQIATHLAWTVNISATTTTILLIAGDPTIADGGLDVDVAVSTRSAITTGQVKAEADQALVDYNVKALLPTALSGGGNMQSDVKEVNDVIITGDGAAVPWGPA